MPRPSGRIPDRMMRNDCDDSVPCKVRIPCHTAAGCHAGVRCHAGAPCDTCVC